MLLFPTDHIALLASDCLNAALYPGPGPISDIKDDNKLKPFRDTLAHDTTAVYNAALEIPNHITILHPQLHNQPEHEDSFVIILSFMQPW